MNIFITGCTSGIGKETVLALAKENHQFFLANRSAEKTAELIKTMQSINPQVQAHAIIVELSSLLSVKKAALDFLQRHQTLDILINNAGVLRDRSFLKMTQEELIEFIETNLYNELGIDSLGGELDVQLKHYTYKTGNDFIQDKVSH